ncbi:hypothetical protein EJ05DRAFT_477312 [Pseudovirgaria hyperparasitica]|uniref:Uncharacterized protein n=1 Tax=Pseudovirgaria hyperparasitica TaxID=470096 RepID=A0A6A6W6A1_9PEZI|nr:uncharacterized protein EJ05DRAFT_477312 [Pseudovirgaria hyperparasitica]KAF2757087.1 hypothetical protein EJ05DRAFT_477312 [Pseudovirgaria hyperparasitica]
MPGLHADVPGHLFFFKSAQTSQKKPVDQGRATYPLPFSRTHTHSLGLFVLGFINLSSAPNLFLYTINLSFLI